MYAHVFNKKKNREIWWSNDRRKKMSIMWHHCGRLCYDDIIQTTYSDIESLPYDDIINRISLVMTSLWEDPCDDIINQVPLMMKSLWEDPLWWHVVRSLTYDDITNRVSVMMTSLWEDPLWWHHCRKTLCYDTVGSLPCDAIERWCHHLCGIMTVAAGVRTSPWSPGPGTGCPWTPPQTHAESGLRLPSTSLNQDFNKSTMNKTYLHRSLCLLVFYYKNKKQHKT